jgi:transcriptional regulator with XRE-family HTH domain
MGKASEAQLTAAGELLRQIRHSVGDESQEKFAKRLPVSRGVIANAETGRGFSSVTLALLREAFPALREITDEIGALLDAEVDAPARSIVAGADNDDEQTEMFTRRSSSATALAGDWFALWESTADREEVINSEQIVIRVKGSGLVVIENVEVSPENPEGGYLWRAEGRVYDNRTYLGTYISRTHGLSKGCLYMVIQPSGRQMNGQWIGCNFDGDWARGLVVFARKPDRLPALLDKHRSQIPVLPYSAPTGATL